MKKILIISIVLFICLIIFPIMAVSEIIDTEIKPANNTASTVLETSQIETITTVVSETEENAIQSSESSTYKETQIQYTVKPEDTEYIISLALMKTKESFCDETIKAVLSICKNNYCYLEENNLEQEELFITLFSDEYYERVKKLYSETDCELRYKGSRVYIPTCIISTGNTATSDEYPYMSSVASVWDVYNDAYKSDALPQCGVSIYGLEHLCKNNSQYKEALKWYLPNFDIS